jgi:thiamine kinase-like enzyme
VAPNGTLADLARTPEGREALTARAVAAAASVAREYGLRVDDPKVLADGGAVRVHLDPAPVVARVSTITSLVRDPVEPWLSREVAVVEFLASQSAPVVAPTDLMLPGPHHADGFVMTFWNYARPISDDVPSAETTGRMLAELHALLRGYPGVLPLLAPPLNDIPRGLERIERRGTLAPADLAFLRDAYERLAPALLEPAAALQPLHGDAHAYNIIQTAEGPLWNDFEDTCLGPVAWDLSSMVDDSGAMAAAYPDAPDAEALEPYRAARLLHATVWVYALAEELPDWFAHADRLRTALRERLA